MKFRFDKQLTPTEEKRLNKEDMMLVYNAQSNKRKWKFHTIGPFKVAKVTPQGTDIFEDLDR